MISEAAIATALFERVKNMSIGIDVVLPREAYNPKHDQPYLDVTWLPNETTDNYVGDNSPTWYQGILQVAVMTAKNTSIIDSANLAGEVIDHFRKGMKISLDGTGFHLKINRQPWLGPSFKDEGWDRLPISISYQTMA